ncbi:helix-turn-helix transcriptional regulator [Lentilactobacillus hilgardii]|uniref:helix-turn-helix transcriptional regulator n=1 Tax=Lentilactobacillus hilgardii TaxID=1588 RepID=UPI0021C4C417|nr:helix-turn-helix transcriptional regulator [Lentilactobacillus hilgardii]
MYKRIIDKRMIDTNYIKQLRIENHYSQIELSRILGFKTAEKYSRRENGIYNFKAQEIFLLAKFYGVPMEKFFTHKCANNEQQAVKSE